MRGRVILDLRGRERRLAAYAGAQGRSPVWSLDGRTIAFVNRSASYYLAFVSVRTGKVIHRWTPGGGFDLADPTWDTTGIYIPNA